MVFGTITGRPVQVDFLGRKRLLSQVLFQGPGRPSDTSRLLFALKGQELKAGLVFTAGGINYSVVRIERNGTPLIRLANVTLLKFSKDGTAFSLSLDRDSGTIRLKAKDTDYFGFSQEVTYAAIEAGLEINGAGARHERLSGFGQVELTAQLKIGEDRPINAIFDEFIRVLSARTEKYHCIEGDGSRLLYTYHNLIGSIGRFLNTFPHIDGIPSLSAEGVEKAFAENPQAAKLLIKFLRIKFDKLFASYYGLRSSDLKSLEAAIRNELESVQDQQAKFALQNVFLFCQAVQNSNAFDYHRNPEVVAFKLDSKAVQKIADHYHLTYPTDITYVYSPRTLSYAIGARFGGEVTKGGDRYYPTTAAAGRFNYEGISRIALEDALRLAFTQETKNLLWGCYVNGLKTVLVAAPIIGETATLEEVQAALRSLKNSRAFPLIRDAWAELKKGEALEKKIETVLAHNNQKPTEALLFELFQLENLVNLSLGEIYLKNLGDKRPGPDMNMAPFQMEFLSVVAKHLGVENWDALYTGKSAEFGGFPHRQLKVTGKGIFENMLIALDKLGLDPEKREVTATVQGFGDVGSAMVYFILNNKPSIKITAISDLTGMLVCPEGVASKAAVREELLRLIREEKPLSEFSRALLVDGIEWRGPERIGEIVTMPATVFIPAAGSNVITDQNVGEVLTQHELVVEAANIPFAVSASQRFDAQGGKRIPGDFANGGGVFTSNNEILGIQILGQDEFISRYPRLKDDNASLVDRTARENSSYFWGQYTLQGGTKTFVDLVKQVTRNMTVVKNIVKVSASLFEDGGIYSFLFDSIFKSIVESVHGDEIIEKLGPSIVKELIASQLARKIIFTHDADWFDSIPAENRDAIILEEARKLIEARKQASGSSSLYPNF